MIKKFITAPEDETIEKILKRVKKDNPPCIAITGEKGVLVGLFTLKELFRNTQPINIPMTGNGPQSAMKIDSGPGIAKRLQKIQMLPVRDFMARKFAVVYPETPTWEGLQLLLEQDSPLVVIDKSSQKPQGIITEQSILEELERMQD
jgi:CBS domain-containing protein